MKLKICNYCLKLVSLEGLSGINISDLEVINDDSRDCDFCFDDKISNELIEGYTRYHKTLQ